MYHLIGNKQTSKFDQMNTFEFTLEDIMDEGWLFQGLSQDGLTVKIIPNC